ncbi:SUMF1/EgtB/PvdO family nonheme iron enzyme [Pajaroellobacter abortibovis]|uniref:Sulfatase-modifying factor enzyme-like domain-containing protein n=1 Tax=Pajaroellobacter abortibovis TaxID=1882918 RepID=A0A1L6MWY3_9BACT|nr:SUMF1/EgtB/PvdO family nonheme iron enzyme [Pajaroellobacter abortibovis]APR99945.1 hypothetical protein BCY86_04055 [Pajaroellobacter abortibovis]
MAKQGSWYLQSTYSEEPLHDQLPVTCITFQEAASYCRWIGGKLFTLEWLLAAQGKGVRLYAWGNEQKTCAHHGFHDYFAGGWSLCWEGEWGTQNALWVKQHPAGK